MKKALIFSFFLSMVIFYGIQRDSDYFKEKLGIKGLNSFANANHEAPLSNHIFFSKNNDTKQEPTLFFIKVEGRIYCKYLDKNI